MKGPGGRGGSQDNSQCQAKPRGPGASDELLPGTGPVLPLCPRGEELLTHLQMRRQTQEGL